MHGSWLRTKRTELGLSQQEMAGIAGVSQQRINAIENGGQLRQGSSQLLKAMVRKAKHHITRTRQPGQREFIAEWAQNQGRELGDMSPQSLNQALVAAGFRRITVADYSRLINMISRYASKGIKARKPVTHKPL